MARVKNPDQYWEDFVNGFIFANYDFEYFHAMRCKYIPQAHAYCNMIRFPKAENGRLVSRTILNSLIDSVMADEALAIKFFGPFAYEAKSVFVHEDEDNYSIVWNVYEGPMEECDDAWFTAAYRWN